MLFFFFFFAPEPWLDLFQDTVPELFRFDLWCLVLGVFSHKLRDLQGSGASILRSLISSIQLLIWLLMATGSTRNEFRRFTAKGGKCFCKLYRFFSPSHFNIRWYFVEMNELKHDVTSTKFVLGLLYDPDRSKVPHTGWIVKRTCVKLRDKTCAFYVYSGVQ